MSRILGLREFLKKKEKVLYLIFSQAFFSANSRGGSWAARINIRKSISFSLERLRTLSRTRTRYSDVVSQIFNEESPWIIFSAKNYPCFLQRSRCYHIWEKNQTGP